MKDHKPALVFRMAYTAAGLLVLFAILTTGFRWFATAERALSLNADQIVKAEMTVYDDPDILPWGEYEIDPAAARRVYHQLGKSVTGSPSPWFSSFDIRFKTDDGTVDEVQFSSEIKQVRVNGRYFRTSESARELIQEIFHELSNQNKQSASGT
ncbi:hypothetical protein [Stratiformator vulcanicus]|uniref:Uncharacterized protein n=1 Tax=Stratiformator vulcanicus TaxID=2527980 RepID=A0A517R3U9_9PLAN|nr:hypothetical protein [Stratiformator vulcanicus]QDT38568.1 hypothetical protein Pan189_29630 [Stratiformator vulcanicus]